MKLFRHSRPKADKADTEDANELFAIEYEHFKCPRKAGIEMHSERCKLR